MNRCELRLAQDCHLSLYKRERERERIMHQLVKIDWLRARSIGAHVATIAPLIAIVSDFPSISVSSGRDGDVTLCR